jgi:hypothetical protein
MAIIPPLPSKVLPGQLISVELMNAFIDEFARLRADSSTGGGTVQVNNLFGLTVAQVRALLQQPTTLITLGAVLDADGASVDVLASANAGLIVLSQSPQAGQLVNPGTPVNLVVSRSNSGGGTTIPPLPNPTITRFENISGVVGSTFRVGESFVIVGNNFASTASQNVVTVGGVPATVVSDAGNPTQRLTVTVPIGIPSAPTTPTGTPLANVAVTVSLRSGSPPVSLNITVNGPSATPGPQIATFTSSTIVGGSLIINGSNFGASIGLNRVFLSGSPASGTVPAGTPPGTIPAVISAASPTQVTVTVPNFGDLPAPVGSQKTSAITLQVIDTGGNVTGSAISSGTFTVFRT